MRLYIPFKVEVKAKASSKYDLSTIENRLQVIANREDVDTIAERKYLTNVKIKLHANVCTVSNGSD